MVLITFFLGTLISDSASAKTITVDDDGGADHEKIQDAIDNASRYGGDTIRVYNGTYRENLVVNKSIELIGNSSSNTSIMGDGFKDTVRITAKYVKFQGFLIWEKNMKNCILVESNENTLSRNAFDTHSGFPPTVEIRGNDNLIHNSELESVRLLISEGEHNRLSHNQLSGNSEIAIVGAGNNTILGNNLSDKSQVYLYDAWVNTILYNNFTLDDGIAILLLEASHNTIRDNSISTGGKGTGIHVVFETFGNRKFPSKFNTIRNNTITDNDYGIKITGPHNNTCKFNSLSRNGVGILVEAGSRDNHIYCNSITGSTVLAADASVNDGILVDLCHNWWGQASGPDQDSGKGVSEGVEFDPWLREWQDFPEDYQPPEVGLVNIYDEGFHSALITQEGDRISFGTSWRMTTKTYHWESSLDGVLYSGENMSFQCSNLSVGYDHTISVRVQDDHGVWSKPIYYGPMIVYAKEKEDEGGFLPGFEIASLVAALVVCLVFAGRKRREVNVTISEK